MQNEILKPIEIPCKKGFIKNPGWARTELMQYTRKNIRAPWFRRKEWDYYLFTNSDFGIAFTISDLGYAGLLSVSFLDFNTCTEHTETELVPLTFGKKFGLGTQTADATAECHTKRLHMKFENRGTDRHISCIFLNFNKATKEDLFAELDVCDPLSEAMYICTPWREKKTAFYYNCKRNCLEAEGIIQYGEREYTLSKETTLGCLDWGRGVWTYINTWYWGTGSGRLPDGTAFGFNLGYGFSDRSSASENVLYYKNKVHKLSAVRFDIPEENGATQFLSPWRITSDDGRFEATFIPILDRAATMDFKVIASDQHQVFGYMNGFAVTDDNERIELKNFLCALEKVMNKY